MAEGFLHRPEVRRYGLPLGSLLLGILLLFFAALPGLNRVLELQEKISDEEARLTVLKEKTEVLADFAGQKELLEEEFALFDGAVPSLEDVPGLLTEVQTISALAGVEITALQFGSKAGKGKGAAGEVSLRYASEGNFPDLLELARDFETASRVIDWESLSYNLQINRETGQEVISAEATLISPYTSEPLLVPENPITFSFADSNFIFSEEILRTLTSY